MRVLRNYDVAKLYTMCKGTHRYKGNGVTLTVGGVLIVLAVSMATMQRLLFSWSMVGE